MASWHRVGGKDDTKEKIAVGRSQCEKRAGGLYVERNDARGEQIHKDWNELEVEGIDQWMKLVENKGWLSNTLRSSGGAGSESEDNG